MAKDNTQKVRDGLRVLLGISGSIAAYKTPQLVRDLQRAGAEVRVAMTPTAAKFVSPLALLNVSRHPVANDMFAAEAQSGGSWHIHLAHWCDVMLIAPCSATSLARLAGGFADNAPAALALALPPNRPLVVAPAMDADMWLHRATQRNVKTLYDDGVQFVGPAGGELASGILGQGRLAEPENIIKHLATLELVAVRKDAAQASGDNHTSARNVSSEPKTYTSTESKPKTEANTPPVVEARPMPQETSANPAAQPEPEVDIVAEALARPTFPLEDAAEANRIQAELDLERIKREHGFEESSEQSSGKSAAAAPETAPTPDVKQDASLRGLNVVITAGPTREKIDDVRFLTNHSTGKMGYALAEVAAARGATVTLVSGPTQLDEPQNVHRVEVQSAGEMFNAVMAEHERSDVYIMSAAVADFTPLKQREGKIKKTEVDGDMNVQLTRTPDILAAVGEHKKEHQVVVGFALEAVDGVKNATSKLERKKADMIVLNHLNGEKSGFGGDENTITLIRADQAPQDFEAMTKLKCAAAIWDAINELRAAQSSPQV